jgi:CheY-like chemotaxis protein
MHLVRNAIDHGIEAPEARAASGKPARGLVRIECRTEGSRISITVSDDGGGLDYPAIRAKAISLWPEDEAEIRQMGDESLVRFLFRPGFTTRATSTALSGRGIGLDIVKTNIEAAKGQIQLDSTPGAGCRFTLLLPVSASTMDGMFVLCSGKKYFIPASAITRTLLVDPTDCFRIRQKEMFSLEGVNIPLAELATSLQVERQEGKARKLPVLLVRGPADTIGIAVDRILSYESLVYQPLPKGLRRNSLVQGIVFDSSFNIIPILNMWAVLDRLRSVRIMDTHRRFTAAKQVERPAILVVDDSISTREIEMSMLELEGYEVLGAVDGVDALEKIRAGRFDLIVSDLNMPRMDGLKLLENIRSDEALKGLPVIFVSTVNEPETRRKAELLGVDRYILKSSFEQDNLISTVRELITRSEAKQ